MIFMINDNPCSMKTPVNIFWFRRDLRLTDNNGLYHALSGKYPVLPVFIFDTNILDKLEEKKDKRISFIHRHLEKIKKFLENRGSTLLVCHGKPLEVFHTLAGKYTIQSVYTNHDYEPYARLRDKQVRQFLETKNTSFYSFKDQVISEKNEVLKNNGDPYRVYTPYMKKWKSELAKSGIPCYPSEDLIHNFQPMAPALDVSPRDLGFEPDRDDIPPGKPNKKKILNYHNTRDIPALDGTSRLGPHIRYGTVSIRHLVSKGRQLNGQWLNELIWREFYMMILWHFPGVTEHAFNAKYEDLDWENDEQKFRAWCGGKTGYPLVDAGMRQLNQTGYMHNRIRMVTAGFLTRHLLIDWKLGEAYFAKKLLDYELSSNNGGWQWAAGTGSDAVPYFRIFNPYIQQQKFDPEDRYIKRYVPEYGTEHYPGPIVDHKEARERALKFYTTGRKK